MIESRKSDLDSDFISSRKWKKKTLVVPKRTVSNKLVFLKTVNYVTFVDDGHYPGGGLIHETYYATDEELVLRLGADIFSDNSMRCYKYLV